MSSKNQEKYTEDQRDHEVSYDDETGVSISIY
jgi:hypothetical protein